MINQIVSLLYLVMALVSLCLGIATDFDSGLYTMSFIILHAIYKTAKD